MKTDVDKARPRRTRDPEAKRAALLDAAMRQFAVHGYEPVSIASIAREAGIAVGTVYRFYGTKLALLRAINESLEDEFAKRMRSDWDAGGTYPARLDRVCEGTFSLAHRHRDLLRVLFMTTDVESDDGTLPGDRLRACIMSMYREAVDAGAFRTGNARFHAAMAHGLVEGAIRNWLRTGSPSRKTAARQLSQFMKYGFLHRT